MLFNKMAKGLFAKDGTNYFLPWMIMIMVFLSILCISLGMSLDKLLSRWESSITGTITVQVLPSQKEIEDNDLFMANISALMISISQTPGVRSARLLEKQELEKLLSPWFGQGELINELTIPQIIDVELDDNMELDFDVLKSLLSYQTANASIDIHRAWLKKLTTLIKSVKLLAYGILLIIIGSTVVLVIYATTTTVSLHKPVIDLLHLIGARDSYVAAQIALKVLHFSLKGLTFGFLAAIPVIISIGYYSASLDKNLSLIISLKTTDWGRLFLCALSVGLISTISAYITVMRKLKQML